MLNHSTDPRIILTLDTGGTNMVFGAMQRGEFIVEPLTLPAYADDLDLCLKTMVEGFRTIIDQLDERPAAISFAFPGPADYPNGIIGGQLLNFPAFRDGVALGPYLKKKFSMPVYINNDGDLYAYGEEISKLASKVYDLDDPEELRQFIKGEQRQIKIYNSEIEVTYDPQKRIGIALSKIGANKAVSLGAYAFALHQLSR